MSFIKNYTTQTNSHRGYTIEELRRLFSKGKEISSENLKKLVDHCFNYELVSGEGIRIIELKNNDLRENTTKTYKIECTCCGEGSGGGECNILVDKGITLDEDDITVIANLYDYTEEGSISEDGIYPVSLSEDGKLIVDMTTANLTVSASAKKSYMEFENVNLQDHFTFNINISGSKLEVYKIETWVEENNVPITGDSRYSKWEYDINSTEVRNLNANRSLILHRDCSAMVDRNNPDSPIIRSGKIKVYYTIKTVEQTPKTASAQTKFIHPILFGWTEAYGSPIYPPTNADGSYNDPDDYMHIAQKIYDLGFSSFPIPYSKMNNPYFKVYSKYNSDYTNNRRNGLILNKTNNKVQLSIRNTEQNKSYILGDYNISVSTTKYTQKYLPTSKNFTLVLNSENFGMTMMFVVLIPISMNDFTKMDSSVDGTTPQDLLDTLSKEDVLIENRAYDNSNPINVKYIAYTLGNAFNSEVEDNESLICSITTL